MTSILKISRPRFWLYLFGPYIVGLASAAHTAADFLRADVAIFAVYFLLPANLLVYGVNDIFDYETDSSNPKKVDYEMLVRPESHRVVWSWIGLSNIPFVAAAFFLTPHALAPLFLFLFFSIFYSAPPIRAKQVPLVDSAFNILYVLPGVFGYQMLTGEFPPAVVIAAAGFWTAAMHAFSAIPDIEADRDARLNTVATKLGATGTHIFCVICYATASVLVFYFAPLLAVLGLVYVAIMLVSVLSGKVFEVYRCFPIVNMLTGFLVFWYVAWAKFL